jgi:hypothetical protein
MTITIRRSWPTGRAKGHLTGESIAKEIGTVVKNGEGIAGKPAKGKDHERENADDQSQGPGGPAETAGQCLATPNIETRTRGAPIGEIDRETEIATAAATAIG